eukprot:CAMPEP_0183707694 /NCGR_PEP_ID=MMETSP0737-20130205/4205_1 /TAXON_ID=385413 /ORGANISM="Thalassiosira miniscula, Strain CCMP1093" /LENGTH=312 /DNA_ID=CAMNT_0025935421 /DNA_START=59 /DNA_END=997 /DNA_ORIENTATION=-
MSHRIAKSVTRAVNRRARVVAAASSSSSSSATAGITTCHGAPINHQSHHDALLPSSSPLSPRTTTGRLRGYSTKTIFHSSNPSNNFPTPFADLTSHHRSSRSLPRGWTSARTILSSPPLYNAPEENAAQEDGDDDPCPPWQNPLHHNNPDYAKVLAEDFAPGEEMPIAPLPPFRTEGSDVLAPPHIHELADEIVRLNMLEVKELVDRIGDHFGFEDDDGDFMGSGGEDGAGGVAEEVVEEEKTAFDVKLTGFDAKSKIKVIKEVRGVTSLGLKEAKDLVEGAPTVVKKDMKKEDAEELKTKLEAVGATIEIV